MCGSIFLYLLKLISTEKKTQKNNNSSSEGIQLRHKTICVCESCKVVAHTAAAASPDLHHLR